MKRKKNLRVEQKDALAKVQREGCRVCGERRDVEMAHIIGRDRDAVLTGPRGGEYIFVHPDSVVGLCGALTDNWHHSMYDRHELDLLPYLNQDEQKRAVEDAGGLIAALNRVTGGKA
jgi:hypothetical protein